MLKLISNNGRRSFFVFLVVFALLTGACWPSSLITTASAESSKVYSVQFEMNGGTLISGRLLQHVPEGEAAVAPELEREGYIQTGWNEDFDSVTEDLIVVALWKKADSPAKPVQTSSPKQWFSKPSDTMSSEEIYAKIAPSVVEIITYTRSGAELSLGSGFFVDDEGVVVTNHHVIEGAASATITTSDGLEYKVTTVLADDKDKDLAVLRTEASGYLYLETSSKDIVTGQTVYALGSSEGLTSTFSTGVVSNAMRVVDGVRYIQMTAPISHGNSGGPLVNTSGEVVGINTSTLEGAQNINFAIRVEELFSLDYSEEHSLEEVSFGSVDPSVEEGKLYFYGLEDHPFDYDKAYELFSEGIDNGNGEAMYYLGELTLMSDDDKRFDKAVDLFESAADNGCYLGLLRWGMMFEQGESYDYDYSSAKELFEEAIEYGCVEANFGLGRLYHYGEGVKSDSKKAIEYYEKAMEGQALNWVWEATCMIGDIYREGAGQIAQDYDKAMEYYTLAADQGSSFAMFKIGWHLQLDLKNLSEAERWYEKAAELGNVRAMNSLGVMYHNGEGKTQNYSKANEWYFKAVALGGRSSMRNLGINYKYGQGVSQNFQEAFNWFYSAAMAGHREAMAQVAFMYFNGQGANKDKESAREWIGYANASCIGKSEDDIFGLYCGLFNPMDGVINLVGYVAEKKLLVINTSRAPETLLVYYSVPEETFIGMQEACANYTSYAYYWNNIANRYSKSSYDISGFCDSISGR